MAARYLNFQWGILEFFSTGVEIVQGDKLKLRICAVTDNLQHPTVSNVGEAAVQKPFLEDEFC